MEAAGIKIIDIGSKNGKVFIVYGKYDKDKVKIDLVNASISKVVSKKTPS